MIPRGDSAMSRKFWIWIRILGWSITLSWFIIYEIDVTVIDLFDVRWREVMGGLLCAIGTFLVLLGYCMLTKEER